MNRIRLIEFSGRVKHSRTTIVMRMLDCSDACRNASGMQASCRNASTSTPKVGLVAHGTWLSVAGPMTGGVLSSGKQWSMQRPLQV